MSERKLSKTATASDKAGLSEAAKRLGIDSLHPEQIAAIRASLEGRDVLLVVPTGFGKSACYQIPALIADGVVLVVSPLLALLQDQERRMSEVGIPVLRFDGTLRGRKRERALEALAAGEYTLVLTTPESLANAELGKTLRRRSISLVAVDEAHCISEWGHDFRPAYREIARRLRTLGSPPLLALTATATPALREGVTHSLKMRDPLVINLSPHRSNLSFEVIPCEGDLRTRALLRLALRLRRPGLIYCSTRREVDALYPLLLRFGISAHRYHAGLPASVRREEQAAFMRARRGVMIATNAFGLGIDKGDLRYVVHYQTPASLEQYVQEAGRAGRDGKVAHCILLYDSEDRRIHEALQTKSRIHPERLQQIGDTLVAWWRERRTPTRASLAVSADLGERTCAALLATLEEGGLVRDQDGEIAPALGTTAFRKGLRALAAQFHRLRTEDGTRHDAIAAYAVHEECRAQFLEAYFGEDRPERCGRCDRCEARGERPEAFFDPLELRGGAKQRTIRRRLRHDPKHESTPPASSSPKKRRRRRRRRRGGRHRGPGRSAPPPATPL